MGDGGLISKEKKGVSRGEFLIGESAYKKKWVWGGTVKKAFEKGKKPARYARKGEEERWDVRRQKIKNAHIAQAGRRIRR